MNKDGFWIVVDDPTQHDDYEDIETISGLNILTGCYGLFLIAGENTTTYEEDAHVMEAFDALTYLGDYPDDVANELYDIYPPEELTQTNIMKLAGTIIQLRKTFEGGYKRRIELEEQIQTLKTEIEQLEKEIEHEQ